jgi:hypothetical protein
MAMAFCAVQSALGLMTMLPFWAYMAPTIFAEVKPERVEEDAIGLANSSVYGLAVALRTRVVPNALICFVLDQ